MTPRHAAFGIAIASLALASAADAAGPRRTALHTAPMAQLYAQYPTVLADYVAASARFRAATAQGLVRDATPLIPRDSAPYFVPWLWTTADGQALRKLPSGAFVVTSGLLLGNIYSEVQCYSAGWPSFMCTDNRERLMSAPDVSTIIFGDVEFARAVPGMDPNAERPAEPSLMSDQTFGPLPKP